MKKPFLAVLGLLGLAIILSGCSGLNILFESGSKPTGETSLSDQMVNELILELADEDTRALAGRSVSSASSRALSSAERDALKAQIRARLATALTAQEKSQTDKIIPVMLQETRAYMYANRASLLDAGTNPDLALVQVLSVAVRSAVKSAAKEGRQELVSNDETGTAKTVETIIAEATSEGVRNITQSVTDLEIRTEGVGLAVKSAVAAIEQAESVNTEKVAAVVQATVKQAVAAVAAEATSTNTDRIQDMVKQVTSNAVQAAAGLTTKATTEIKQAVASQVVQAAVQTILQTAVTNTSLQDSLTATSLVETVVAGASEAIEEYNEASGVAAIVVESAAITDAIQAAVAENELENEGTPAPVIDTTNVATILVETRPVIGSFGITATLAAVEYPSVDGSLELNAAPELLAFEATATPSAGTTIGYSWTQVQGPSQLELGFGGNFELAIDVNQFRPGTYEFRLTANNVGGTKSASATVTLSCVFTGSVAQEAYALGMSYLRNKRYDAAYLQFTRVMNELAAEDVSELANAAKLWTALLQVSNLAVDPELVDLARNKLGFIDYPQSMESLFSDQWMSSDQFYTRNHVTYLTESSFGLDSWSYIPLRFVANSAYPRVESDRLLEDGSTSYTYVDAYIKTELMENGSIKSEHIDYNARGYFTAEGAPNCYVRYDSPVPTATIDEFGWPVLVEANSLYADPAAIVPYEANWQSEFFPAIAPRMAVPAFADTEALKDYWDLYSSWDDTLPENLASRYPVSSIGQIMAMNVIANYGSGLNSLIDSVVAGPLARFDEIIAIINSLPDEASIDLPLDLIESYVTLDEMGRAIASKFATITTGELKTFGAQLLIAKTYIQLMSAYDMDYNMDALKPLMANMTEWDETANDLVLKPELDLDGNLIADPVEDYLSTAASPLAILTVRDSARLAEAKASFSTALTMIQEALVILENRAAAVTDLMPPSYDPDTGEPTAMDAQLLIYGLRNAGTLFANIQTALDENLETGGLVSIPMELFSNPMALMVESYNWTAEGMGLKPGRLFDYVTDDLGRKLGAFTPAHVFEKTPNGDFAVKVNYVAEQYDLDTGESITTILNDAEGPLDAFSEAEVAYFQACVDMVKDTSLNLTEFEARLYLAGSAEYLDWLGLVGPPLLVPVADFDVSSSWWSSDPSVTDWHAEFDADAAKERLMMELTIDYIAVE